MSTKTTKKGKKPAPNLGSNSKLTEENRVKIKEVAALDGTIEEMAYFCNVSRQTIYNWFQQEPELFDEVERLRAKPILKARNAVVKGLDNYQNGMDYLKRKKRSEFGDKVDHDISLKTMGQLLDELEQQNHGTEIQGSEAMGTNGDGGDAPSERE